MKNIFEYEHTKNKTNTKSKLNDNNRGYYGDKQQLKKFKERLLKQ